MHLFGLIALEVSGTITPISLSKCIELTILLCGLASIILSKTWVLWNLAWMASTVNIVGILLAVRDMQSRGVLLMECCRPFYE